MKTLLLTLFVCIMVSFSQAQSLQPIKLVNPDKTRGSATMKAFADRQSTREFATRKLSDQDLSDLLWATNGINRNDGKRTAPSCMNFQEIDVFVVLPEGTYLYDAKAHSLMPLTAGDYRAAVAGSQVAVKDAPLFIVLAADLTKFGGVNEDAKLMGAVDVGIVCQNINIACSALGMVTVPRGTMNKDELNKVLKLKDVHLLLMNNPVGYPK